MSFAWTDVAVERLRQGCIEHEPFPLIAEAIGGGVTRCACIGKSRRLGFSPGHKPANPNRLPHKRLGAPETSRPRVVKAAPRLRAEPIPPRAPIVCDAPSNPIKIFELDDYVCHWPCWSDDAFPDAEHSLYCGAPANARPYCSAHMRISTNRAIVQATERYLRREAAESAA